SGTRRSRLVTAGPARRHGRVGFFARDYGGLPLADDRANLGRRGEKLARKFLEKLGYRTIVRNYRCPAGELDLISLDQRSIVFVEVKTRRSEEAADVERAVNPAKQRQLMRVARYYLASTPTARRYPCRFDVVGIVCSDNGNTEIRHIRDAF
ncbi:MAG: YraN family protein, partial [Phycisphaerae bacterium]